jgi:hypothetical protein
MTEGAYATEGIGWGGVWLRCGGGGGEYAGATPHPDRNSGVF